MILSSRAARIGRYGARDRQRPPGYGWPEPARAERKAGAPAAIAAATRVHRKLKCPVHRPVSWPFDPKDVLVQGRRTARPIAAACASPVATERFVGDAK